MLKWVCQARWALCQLHQLRGHYCSIKHTFFSLHSQKTPVDSLHLRYDNYDKYGEENYSNDVVQTNDFNCPKCRHSPDYDNNCIIDEFGTKIVSRNTSLSSWPQKKRVRENKKPSDNNRQIYFVNVSSVSLNDRERERENCLTMVAYKKTITIIMINLEINTNSIEDRMLARITITYQDPMINIK